MGYVSSLEGRLVRLFTPPKTNMEPARKLSQKETIVFQSSIFRGYVGFREGRSIDRLVRSD